MRGKGEEEKEAESDEEEAVLVREEEVKQHVQPTVVQHTHTIITPRVPAQPIKVAAPDPTDEELT